MLVGEATSYMDRSGKISLMGSYQRAFVLIRCRLLIRHGRDKPGHDGEEAAKRMGQNQSATV